MRKTATKETFRWYFGELQEQYQKLNQPYRLPYGEWTEENWHAEMHKFKNSIYEVVKSELQQLQQTYNTTKREPDIFLEQNNCRALQDEVGLSLLKQAVEESHLYCHQKGFLWNKDQLQNEVKHQLTWQYKKLEMMTLLPPEQQRLFSCDEVANGEQIQREIGKIKSFYAKRNRFSKWWKPSYDLIEKHAKRKATIDDFNWYTQAELAEKEAFLHTALLRKTLRAWKWEPSEIPCQFFRFVNVPKHNFEITKSPISKKMYTAVTHKQLLGSSEAPAMVSWTKAAIFCNILSKKEGLEEVYEINSPQEITYFSGHVKHVDITTRFERNGYRLPTWKEWLFVATEGHAQPMPQKTSKAIYQPEDLSSLAKIKRKTSPFIRELPKVQISTLQGAPDEDEFINFSFVDDSLVPTMHVENETQEPEEEEPESSNPIGLHPPNAFGCVDTWRNGWEWCTDKKDGNHPVIGLGFVENIIFSTEAPTLRYPQDLSWIPAWTQDNCIGFRVLRPKSKKDKG